MQLCSSAEVAVGLAASARGARCTTDIGGRIQHISVLVIAGQHDAEPRPATGLILESGGGASKEVVLVIDHNGKVTGSQMVHQEFVDQGRVCNLNLIEPGHAGLGDGTVHIDIVDAAHGNEQVLARVAVGGGGPAGVVLKLSIGGMLFGHILQGVVPLHLSHLGSSRERDVGIDSASHVVAIAVVRLQDDVLLGLGQYDALHFGGESGGGEVVGQACDVGIGSAELRFHCTPVDFGLGRYDGHKGDNGEKELHV